MQPSSANRPLDLLTLLRSELLDRCHQPKANPKGEKTK